MSTRDRQDALLARITEQGGEWTTESVHRLYKAQGLPNRATARGDLKDLAKRGALTLNEAPNRRFFTRPDCGGA